MNLLWKTRLPIYERKFEDIYLGSACFYFRFAENDDWGKNDFHKDISNENFYSLNSIGVSWLELEPSWINFIWKLNNLLVRCPKLLSILDNNF